MPSISEKAISSPFTVATFLPILIQKHIDALTQVDAISAPSMIGVEPDTGKQDRVLQAAFEDEQAALERLLQYSPRNLTEVRTKTAYFIENLDFIGCEDPHMLMFLRAMI
jgi:hypothetical protein